MKRLDACLYHRSIQHCAVSSGLIWAAGNGIQPFGSLSWLALPFGTKFDAYHLPWQLQTDGQTDRKVVSLVLSQSLSGITGSGKQKLGMLLYQCISTLRILHTSTVYNVWGSTRHKPWDADSQSMRPHRKQLKTLEVSDPRERCVFSKSMNVWTNELGAGTLYVSIQR